MDRRVRGIVLGLGIGIGASVVTALVLNSRNRDDVDTICVSESCAEQIGELPGTSIVDFSGEATSLSDQLGKAGRPLVVNFWASSCKPCVQEMPALETVWQARKIDVKVIGINVGEELGVAETFATETGVSFELFRDPPSNLFNALQARGLPTTLYVTTDGRIIDRHTGELDQTAFAAGIDALLTAEEALR
jgi:thiol-disulfide isomerase/thioredoxin